MGDGYGPLIIAPSREGLLRHAFRRRTPRNGSQPPHRRPGRDDQRLPGPPAFPWRFRCRPGPIRPDIHPCRVRPIPRRPHHPRRQITYAGEDSLKILDLGRMVAAHHRPAPPARRQCHPQGHPFAERSIISSILYEAYFTGSNHRAAAVEHSMPLARGMTSRWPINSSGLYVNDYTLDYGDDIGRRATTSSWSKGHEAGIIPCADGTGVRSPRHLNLPFGDEKPSVFPPSVIPRCCSS